MMSTGIFTFFFHDTSICNRLATLGLLLLLTAAAPSAYAWTCGTTVPVTTQGNLSFCPGDSVILTAPSETGMTYVWKKNGVAVSGGTNASLIVKETGSYYVVITIGACLDSSDLVATTLRSVRVGPNYTPVGLRTACEGASVQLNKRVLGGSGAFSLQWYRNDVPIPGETNIIYHARESGIYKLFAVDSTSGCSGFSDNHTEVVIYPKPAAVITPAGPDIKICNGDTLTLETTTAYIKSYAWEQDSALVWDEPTFDVGAGVYRIILVDSNNCMDTSDYLAITAIDPPVASLFPDTDTAFCQGSAFTLAALTTDTGILYRWKKDNNDIASAQADSLSITESGTYSVVIYSNAVAHCADSTAAVEIVVHALPDPEIVQHDSVLTTTEAYLSYQWYHNGQPAGQDRTYIPVADGDYTVSVTDSNGCTNVSDAINIELEKEPPATIDAYQQTQVSVFPNPANNVLHISSDIRVNITIISLEGKTVYTGDNTANTITVSDLPEGIYLMRITDRHGMLLQQQKLVKASR